MKIYTNPNFPRPPRAERAYSAVERHTRGTAQLLDDLSARNKRALDDLQTQRVDRTDMPSSAPAPHRHHVDIQARPSRGTSTHCHRFSGMTGTAITVPGGHVHFVNGQTEFSRKKSE